VFTRAPHCRPCLDSILVLLLIVRVIVSRLYDIRRNSLNLFRILGFNREHTVTLNCEFIETFRVPLSTALVINAKMRSEGDYK
jgi:hypothetical protein